MFGQTCTPKKISHNDEWRSLLFVPANQKKLIKSSVKKNASAIIIDLEDSVLPVEKPQARQELQESIATLYHHRTNIIVRINHDILQSAEDLKVAVNRHVCCIMIPKAMSKEHITLLDNAVTILEKEYDLNLGAINFIPIIETLHGLDHVDEIAHASPRNIALAMGSEDLALSVGFEPTNDNLFNPAQKIIYAAKKANLQAYGFPGSIADYSDLEGFTELQKKAKSMGFSGALCIHPSQVDIVNHTYEVSEQELATAMRIVDVYNRAMMEKKGTAALDGKMIDEPVVKKAKSTIRKAKSLKQSHLS